MQRSWILALGLLAGCGRLSFDSIVDGSVASDGATDTPSAQCSRFGAWGNVQPLSVLDEATLDADPWLSPDGLTLYYDKQFDIWTSTRASLTNAWETPHPVPEVATTSGEEANPALSSDLLEIYYGVGLVYTRTRTSTSTPFGAESVVIPDSTAYQGATGAVLANNNLDLYFGGYVNGPIRSIFHARRPSRTAAFDLDNAVKLLLPGDNAYPAISANGLELYYSKRTMDAEFDLYVVTRPSTAVEFDASTETELVDLNSDLDDSDPGISFDGTELFFDSTRPGGRGDYDLYVATRACLD